jgi:hypothetical protein
VGTNTPAILEVIVVLLCRALAQMDAWPQIRVLYRDLGWAARDEGRSIPLDKAGRADLRESLASLATWLRMLQPFWQPRGAWWPEGKSGAWAKGIAYAAAVQATELLDVYARLFQEKTELPGYWGARQPIVLTAQNAATAWAEIGHGLLRNELALRSGLQKVTDKTTTLDEMVGLAKTLGMDAEATKQIWNKLLGSTGSPGWDYLQGEAVIFAARAEAVRLESLVWAAHAEYVKPGKP